MAAGALPAGFLVTKIDERAALADSLEMWAANGDQLWGEYTVPQVPFWVTITGGTGRFARATGGFLWSVTFWGEVGPNGMPVNPWHFKGSLEGTISY